MRPTICRYAAFLSVLLLAPLSALGMSRVQVPCTVGGKVVVSGVTASSTRVMASYPQCTVTVYKSGLPHIPANLATLYSDNGTPPTPMANPFTADVNGFGWFYVADGIYDIQISGGSAPSLPAPYTYSAVNVMDAYVLQNASGAVPYLKDTRMKESPHVGDFGALCNGAADDTAAFIAAGAWGRSFFVPYGTCLVKSQVVLTGVGQQLNCAGMGGVFGGASQTVIKAAAGADATVTNATTGSIIKLSEDGQSVRGCEVDGNSIAAYGILAQNAARSVVEHTYVHNAVYDGILLYASNHLDNNNLFTYINTNSSYNGRDGFSQTAETNSGNQVKYLNVDAVGNGRDGLRVDGYGASIDGGNFAANTNCGITLGTTAASPGATSPFIMNPTVEANTVGQICEGGAGFGNSHGIIFTYKNNQPTDFYPNNSHYNWFMSDYGGVIIQVGSSYSPTDNMFTVQSNTNSDPRIAVNYEGRLKLYPNATTGVTADDNAYIYPLKGGGVFPYDGGFGALVLQSRSSADRPIQLITGSTPTAALTAFGTGRVAISPTSQTDNGANLQVTGTGTYSGDLSVGGTAVPGTLNSAARVLEIKGSGSSAATPVMLRLWPRSGGGYDVDSPAVISTFLTGLRENEIWSNSNYLLGVTKTTGGVTYTQSNLLANNALLVTSGGRVLVGTGLSTDSGAVLQVSGKYAFSMVGDTSANLGLPPGDTTITWCTNCAPSTNPCTAGSGALAISNGAGSNWRCL